MSLYETLLSRQQATYRFHKDCGWYMTYLWENESVRTIVRTLVLLFQLVINLHSAPWRLARESLVQWTVTAHVTMRGCYSMGNKQWLRGDTERTIVVFERNVCILPKRHTLRRYCNKSCANWSMTPHSTRYWPIWCQPYPRASELDSTRLFITWTLTTAITQTVSAVHSGEVTEFEFLEN